MISATGISYRRKRNPSSSISRNYSLDIPCTGTLERSVFTNTDWSTFNVIDNSSQIRRELLVGVLSRYKDPDIWNHLPFTGVKNIDFELERFYSKAKLFEDTTGYSGIEVIRSSFNEGANYAEKCKKQIQSGFLSYHGSPELKENLKEYTFIDQTAYNQVFPPQHLPYFKPDKVDDALYYFYPKSEISLKDKIIFKDSLRKLLSTYVKKSPMPPSEIEMLSSMKTSTILTTNRNKFHGQERIDHPDFKPQFKLRGKRVIVYVSPANERDSIKWDIRSLDTIALISYLTKQILDFLPMSAMSKSPDKGFRREKDVKRFRKDWAFYVRDVKKCGITTDTTLFDLIREVLVETYPLVGFEYISAYSDILIENCGEEIEGWVKPNASFRPQRGHGLGSANELMTLVQCILFQIRSDELDLDWSRYKSVSWNDDLLETCCVQYSNIIKQKDIEVCERFQVLVKKTHTGILYGGHVFCEEYESIREFDVSKELRVLLSLREQRYSRNIVSAKNAIRSLSDDIRECHSWEIEKELASLITFWGYEFFPNEHELPAQFGGWIRSSNLGLDTSLIDIFDESLTDFSNHILLRILKAEEKTIKEFVPRMFNRFRNVPNTKGKIWEFGTVIGEGSTDIPGLNLSLLRWDKRDLTRSHLFHVGQRSIPAVYWDRLQKERILAYNNFTECKSSITEVYLINYYLSSRYPSLCILPSKYIEEWTTDVTPETGLTELQLLGEENIHNIDEMDLISGILKREGKVKVMTRSSVENVLLDIKQIHLEGHMTSIQFDGRSNLYRSKRFDEQYFNYSYLPILIQSYYWCRYGGIPSKIREEITLPQILIKPDLLGLEIPRDMVVSPFWKENLFNQKVAFITAKIAEGDFNDNLRRILLNKYSFSISKELEDDLKSMDNLNWQDIEDRLFSILSTDSIPETDETNQFEEVSTTVVKPEKSLGVSACFNSTWERMTADVQNALSLIELRETISDRFNDLFSFSDEEEEESQEAEVEENANTFSFNFGEDSFEEEYDYSDSEEYDSDHDPG